MRISKRILIGAAALILLVLLLICFWPRPLISSPYTVSDSISSDRDICVSRVAFDGHDLSGQLDAAALVEILSRYSCRMSPFASSSEPSLENAWEINLIRGGKPFHIVIGESAYCGSSAPLHYSISNADSLRQEIDLLRQEIQDMQPQ